MFDWTPGGQERKRPPRLGKGQPACEGPIRILFHSIWRARVPAEKPPGDDAGSQRGRGDGDEGKWGRKTSFGDYGCLMGVD